MDQKSELVSEKENQFHKERDQKLLRAVLRLYCDAQGCE